MLSPPNRIERGSAPSAVFPFALGQYQVVEKIGQGGMGAVYRALHPFLKKELAIKILPTEATAEPRAVARFRREMEAVGRLDHQHIVRATDAGEIDGIHFLVMELVNGLDLSRLVRLRGRLGVADTCELIRQAAAGLHCAHEHGLVHRDVKPSNLILSRKGQVKVLDLGLALLNQGGRASREVTASGQMMGTADYMAPEQWEASHDVDARADIYSLGCTLYTLLVGQPPFGGAKYVSAFQKMAAHISEPVPAVRAERADVPARLEDLLARMTAKGPADRPVTLAEVVETLGPLCPGANLSALAVEGLARAGAAVSPDRATLPDRAAALTPSAESSHAPRPAVSAFRLSSQPVLVVLAALIFLGAALAATVWVWRGGRALEQTSGPAAAPFAEKVSLGRWYDLLARQPVKRFWRETGPSRLDHNPKDGILGIHSLSPALVRLGETQHRSYRLQVGFRQLRWVGGIGVYFGGTATSPSDQFSFQLIELRQLGKLHGQFTLTRSTGVLKEEPDGRPHVPTQQFASTSLPGTLENSEQVLDLDIHAYGLARVRWDRYDCAALAADTPTSRAALKGASNRGEFGIYCVGADVTVQTARFMPTE